MLTTIIRRPTRFTAPGAPPARRQHQTDLAAECAALRDELSRALDTIESLTGQLTRMSDVVRELLKRVGRRSVA